MKNILTIALLLITNGCLAQVFDQFSDGDFTANPNWSGHSAHFIVNSSQQLQLNNTVAGASFLTTPFESTVLDNFEWNVYVKQTFSPSGSNYGRIYLVSTQANLTQPLNGYYLQFGEAGSTDAVELFRQSGTVSTSVCRATNAMISSSFAIRIRVTRDPTALWKLMIDYTGGTSFVTEALGVDATFTASSFLGLLCVYTVGNANKFFFDDISGGPPPGDTTPPVIQNLSAPAPSELLLTFSERMDASSAGVLTNFQVNNGVGNPVLAMLQNDQKTLHLTFFSHFVNGAAYQLSITGVKDEAQNIIIPASHDFRHFVPQSASFRDLVITELFPDPAPQIGLPTQEFVEVFNRSDKAFDLASWKLSDPTTTASLPSVFILPGDYLVVTNSSAVGDYSLFGMAVGLANFPTLNNSSDVIKLSDPNGLTIDSVNFSSSWYQDDDKSQGGYTLERLNPEIDTNEPTNWRASEDISGGTPGKQNSVFGRNPDSKPPRVISLEVASDTTLILTFDEEIEAATGLSVDNYLADHSVGKPSSVSLLTGQRVKLQFATPFVNGLDHQLSISDIKDIAGNEMIPVDLNFRFFIPGEIGTGIILINEIMADPTPVVQLPEAEFIEVVNVSSFPYDLNGWKLSDATSTVSLPSRIILPGETLVLTSTSNLSKFSAYGNILGVSNFPSLGNTGEAIALKDTAGILIDSVNYHLSWYEDKAKEDGGWTLERLQFNFSSTDQTNWRASEDGTGGTPGKQNSVFGRNPDSKPPRVISLEVASDTTLVLTFDEEIQADSALFVHSFLVDHSVGKPSLVSLLTGQRVKLQFATLFLNGLDHHLRISGIKDIAGNEMTPVDMNFRFFIPGEIGTGIILINEIMADPTPVVQLPEAEFIEVVNVSSSPYDLKGWKLSDATSTVSLPSRVILPGETLVLTSTSNLSKFSTYGNILGVSNFPSLSNTGEAIALKDTAGILIDSVNYHLSWYEDKAKEDGGWSLERLQFNFSSTDQTNWRASEDSTGGTPGKQNSVFGRNPDSKPPRVISLEVASDTTLILTFDEEIQAAPGLSVDNYLADHSVGRPSLVSLLTGQRVKLQFATSFVNGPDHHLSISGIKDIAGNEMTPVDMNFRFFIPGEIVTGIILINEIMADPTPVVQLPEAEFIEVVNVSSFPYDLKGWKLSDATSTVSLPTRIILPGETLVLTSTSNLSKFSAYGNILGVSNFPSLGNTGEAIALKDTAGILIDSVNYHLSWYEDKAKEEGGWSLERLQFNFSSTDQTNWRASEDSTGGTPGKQNSVFGKNPDTKAPEIVSLLVVAQDELYLEFNEPLDSLYVGTQLFSASDLGYPMSVSLSRDSKNLSLQFGTLFQNGVAYTLSISGLMDMAGNLLADVDKSFRYFKSVEARPKDILIMEIMADPSPTVQLPEAEYIEIFNRTEDPFDLGGWKLRDGQATAVLPSEIIFPSQFLILTSVANQIKFSSEGKATGVTNFPSLNNEGESLILQCADGRTIDSVNYSSEWYGNREQADGGWSLELIDPANLCGEEDNWTAAENERGGTPGQQNSVLANKPDLQGPKLVSVFPVGEGSIHAVFDEKLDKASVVAGAFLIEPPVNIIYVAFADPSLRSVLITLESPLVKRILYRLRVVEVLDCNRNAIQDQFNTIAFSISEKAEASDVIINEILFNPKPNGVDFIEAYNRTPKFINLRNWNLANVEEGQVTGEKLISVMDRVLAPYSYAVFTTDPLTVKNQYPMAREDNFYITSLPSMPDDEGTIALVDGEGNTIDQLAYSDKLHSPLIKDDEGVSLERVLAESSSSNPANWRSANSVSGYATPGYFNSNSRPEAIVDSGEVIVSPEIISSVNSDGFAQIRYRFEEGGYLANVKVYDVEGRFVKEIANNESIGFEGFFRWDGDRDDGSKARSGYYIVWFEIFSLDGTVKTFRKRVILVS